MWPRAHDFGELQNSEPRLRSLAKPALPVRARSG